MSDFFHLRSKDPNLDSERRTPHDESVVDVAKIFESKGWDVVYDPIVTSPSGVPVHADLRLKKPDGHTIYIECKIGDKDSHLPITGYAQAAQLVASGVSTIVYTNMKVSGAVAELFEHSKIPVIQATTSKDHGIFVEGLKKAAAQNPSLDLKDF